MISSLAWSEASTPNPRLSFEQLTKGQIYRGTDEIQSQIFPELRLTAQQIFQGEG